MTQILYYTFTPFLDRIYTIASTNSALAYISPDDGDLTPLSYYFKNYDLVDVSELEASNAEENLSLIKQARQQLEEYETGQREKFDLPLDLSHGTPFQQAVWNCLLSIPYGQTTTYGDIAQHINNPKAVRAVGGAIGKNPISIIVPCHRIIGKDGSLTGYSGGLDVKTKLLTIENIQLL